MRKTSLRKGLIIVFTPILAAVFALSFALFPNIQKASAGAPTCTWTGSGGSSNKNFSNASNWTCDTGTIPDNGTTLIFPETATNKFANNDLASSKVFSGIAFNGHTTDCTTGAPYSISGNIYLAGNITDTNGSQCAVGVAPDGSNSYGTDFSGLLTLSANSNISMGDTLVLSGGISMLSYNATFSRGANISQYASPSIHAGAYANSAFNQSIIGSGVLTLGDSIYLQLSAPATNFSGSLVENGSATTLAGDQFWTSPTPFNQSFGTATITLNGTSTLRYYLYSGFAGTTITIPNAVNINSTGFAGSFAQISITTGDSDLYSHNNASITSVIGNSFQTVYKQYDSGKTINFTGAISLTKDLKIESGLQTATLTGALSGAGYNIFNQPTNGVNTGQAGSVVVNGSTNTTATANSTINQVTSTYNLGINDGLRNYYLGRLFDLNLGGHTIGAILLQNSGTLSGVGTTGNLTSQTGIVSPGSTSATLNTGNISLDSTSSYIVQIAGAAAGQYSQLNATGTVSLGSAALNISTANGFAPALNDVYTIVNNDASDAITGIFTGLAQYARVTVSGYTYKISYIGGTGNDVTLTVTGTPGAPDTAGAISKPASIAVVAGVISAGVGLLVIRSKFLKLTRKATVRVRK